MKDVRVGQRYQSTHLGIVTVIELGHTPSWSKKPHALCRIERSGAEFPFEGYELIGPAEEHELVCAQMARVSELLLDPSCTLEYRPTLKESKINMSVSPRALATLLNALERMQGGGEGESVLAELMSGAPPHEESRDAPAGEEREESALKELLSSE